MKATTLILAAIITASATAQVFTPPRTQQDRKQSPNQLTFMFTTINTNIPGDPTRTGAILAGEFALEDKFNIGFWAVADQANGAPGLKWFEAHATLFIVQRPNGVLGVSVGLFGVTESGGENSKWSEFALVGSTTLDHERKWTLGFNIGFLNSQDTFGGGGAGLPGATTGEDGTSYGVNLDYKLSESWSLGAAVWIIDLDNGTNINRNSLGGSFRF